MNRSREVLPSPQSCGPLIIAHPGNRRKPKLTDIYQIHSRANAFRTDSTRRFNPVFFGSCSGLVDGLTRDPCAKSAPPAANPHQSRGESLKMPSGTTQHVAATQTAQPPRPEVFLGIEGQRPSRMPMGHASKRSVRLMHAAPVFDSYVLAEPHSRTARSIAAARSRGNAPLRCQ